MFEHVEYTLFRGCVSLEVFTVSQGFHSFSFLFCECLWHIYAHVHDEVSRSRSVAFDGWQTFASQPDALTRLGSWLDFQ